MCHEVVLGFLFVVTMSECLSFSSVWSYPRTHFCIWDWVRFVDPLLGPRGRDGGIGISSTACSPGATPSPALPLPSSLLSHPLSPPHCPLPPHLSFGNVRASEHSNAVLTTRTLSCRAGRSMVMEMTLLDAGIASSARRASLPMTKTNLSKGRLVHLPSARLVYEADQKIKQ